VEVQKEDKERVVAELTEKLRLSETLIVADYRGLTMPQIDNLRAKLIEHGARLNVVKNTLTRRAAEAAGADALLTLLEGPSAIAFIEADGDLVAVAKALAQSARDTKVLEIRGGVMQGRTISGADVEELAKLPPFDVLRSQVLAAIIAPLTAFVALAATPLQDLYGLIDARIEQLGGSTETPEPAAEAAVIEDAVVEDETAAAEPAAEEPAAIEEVAVEAAAAEVAEDSAADEPDAEPTETQEA
jgi:large subunit ribosomal protein L10